MQKLLVMFKLVGLFFMGNDKNEQNELVIIHTLEVEFLVE